VGENESEAEMAGGIWYYTCLVMTIKRKLLNVVDNDR
jgi:hypothetical protein